MCNISEREGETTTWWDFTAAFRLEKGALFQNIYKNVYAGEYINHNKATASLTDKQRGAGTNLTAFLFLNMFGKAKTHRAIKRASIAVSAGLEAGREIVTL